MTAFVTVIATAITLAGIGWLAVTDPKRRRVFEMSDPARPRRTVPVVAAAFIPGIALLALGNGAAFVVWLGATTVFGWGIAALTPARTAALVSRCVRVAAQLRAAVVARRRMADRIASLEARMAALEEAVGRSGGIRQDRNPRRAVAEPEMRQFD